MGIQVLPNFDNASPKSRLHLVSSRPITHTAKSDQLTFELPRYSADIQTQEPDGLGCIRGIAMALVIQAFFAVLVFGAWELRHLLR